LSKNGFAKFGIFNSDLSSLIILVIFPLVISTSIFSPFERIIGLNVLSTLKLAKFLESSERFINEGLYPFTVSI